MCSKYGLLMWQSINGGSMNNLPHNTWQNGCGRAVAAWTRLSLQSAVPSLASRKIDCQSPPKAPLLLCKKLQPFPVALVQIKVEQLYTWNTINSFGIHQSTTATRVGKRNRKTTYYWVRIIRQKYLLFHMFSQKQLSFTFIRFWTFLTIKKYWL